MIISRVGVTDCIFLCRHSLSSSGGHESRHSLESFVHGAFIPRQHLTSNIRPITLYVMLVLAANQWLCPSHNPLKSRCFPRSSSSSTLEGLEVYLTLPSSIFFLDISGEEPCGGAHKSVHAALSVSVYLGLPSGANMTALFTGVSCLSQRNGNMKPS